MRPHPSRQDARRSLRLRQGQRSLRRPQLREETGRLRSIRQGGSRRQRNGNGRYHHERHAQRRIRREFVLRQRRLSRILRRRRSVRGTTRRQQRAEQSIRSTAATTAPQSRPAISTRGDPRGALQRRHEARGDPTAQSAPTALPVAEGGGGHADSRHVERAEREIERGGGQHAGRGAGGRGVLGAGTETWHVHEEGVRFGDGGQDQLWGIDRWVSEGGGVFGW
mmetsp:Transcript_31389/g.65674  ORF Transcript_31389/g.65674 Transcript_31389/m.65674 type:complete len:223 (+) Transcript_31389:310-978(+)